MSASIGVVFDGFDDTSEMMRLARAAEAVGAGSVWIAEHMGYREAITACAAIAATTERIRLVPTALTPYLWHPVPTAMALSTLAEIAPGRCAVAVSVGNVMNLKESGHEPVRPVATIGSFVKDIRALWTGDAVQSEAPSYRLEGARMAFSINETMPIYVASTGPQVLRLSGRIADGVLLSGGLTLASTRACLANARAGLEAAGRDPGELSRASFIYYSVSEDGSEAIADLKTKLAFLFRSRGHADNIASAGLAIDHEAIMAAVARRDLDGATALIPDEAIESFCVGGTPDACRAQLGRYIDAGLDEALLQISGTEKNKALALDLLGSFVREFG